MLRLFEILQLQGLKLVKVKLFFYIEDKKVKNRVFPEEWYTVLADEFGADQVTQDFQPWLEVSITTPT